ncbi:MAG: putative ferrochelatase [Thermodesulfobacteriota bacterium]|nr:MAG: putative ferrochelatase [Thermodesulfobacteriota bacterium]
MSKNYDAILMIGYGAPEKIEDIRPFLQNVAKGRPIPPDRLEEVAHHYELFGGKSPLNEYTYKQGNGLHNKLAEYGHDIPVYVGMRNWHPLTPDTIKEMSDNGHKNIIGMIMAAHQSDASWERYQRDVQEALTELGIEMDFDYSPPLFDHPLFIEDSADRVQDCLDQIPEEEYPETMILFTAHSIPVPMAEASPYVQQLKTTARLIAERLNYDNWRLVYQSRSGRPTDPWLEPDVCDVIEEIAKEGVKNVIAQPIGFICDHIEVLFDIGVEAQETSDEVGIKLLRAKTVNDDPKFIKAMADVVLKMME